MKKNTKEEKMKKEKRGEEGEREEEEKMNKEADTHPHLQPCRLRTQTRPNVSKEENKQGEENV